MGSSEIKGRKEQRPSIRTYIVLRAAAIGGREEGEEEEENRRRKSAGHIKGLEFIEQTHNHLGNYVGKHR